jgi:YD repeat-containing protein
MAKPIKKYDENNNLVYYRDSDGFEFWREYDENNNLIYGRETLGFEFWYKWENSEQIDITEQKLYQIKKLKEQKEFLSRKEILRFELKEL